MSTKILPGKHYPLGATWTGEGTNFAIYSEVAQKIEICLFDSPNDRIERERITLPEMTDHIWHGLLPEVQPRQLYGYRIHGVYEPEAGVRCNPNKLLIDPYARAIAGKVNWLAPVFPYNLGHPDSDLSRNDEDDAWGMPKCVVTNPVYDWEGDYLLRIPWHKSLIYEVHVKGFTARNHKLAPEIRGTFAGLSSPQMIEYLKNLGITAIELMPVHDPLDDKYLADRGLRNYWGYNTTNFFSPLAYYSSRGDTGEQVGEFKSMVKALHRSGIEVILDVVYNHTSEGNNLGPILSFRGIDNKTYYRMVQGNERYYMDYTGTGNTLNVRHPQVLKLIMDSLRYWVQEMHVDGFRFDLAAALAREFYDVDRLSAFFDIIHQDPIISTVKLIAEPWDVGPGGYQVGKFPVLWTEWNGKFRDAVRRYWKGDDGQTAELAYRLTGSSDLYQQDGKRPHSSINFITAHDGFTLNDLVSYDQKHNEANGEGNKDGSDNNYSWNCGAEGPTDDKAIIELRERQKRNLLSVLMFSQGVPLIQGGDEISRSQLGNNNAYCHDSELTWFNWELDSNKQALLDFTRRIIRLRNSHPLFQRRCYFSGGQIRGSNVKDIMWLRSDGQEMSDSDWNSTWIRCIGVFYAGHTPGDVDEKGYPIIDETMLIIINSHHEPVKFTIPTKVGGPNWEFIIDTNNPALVQGQQKIQAGEQLELAGRSLVMLARLEAKKSEEKM